MWCVRSEGVGIVIRWVALLRLFLNLSIEPTQADLSAALVAMHLWADSYTVVLLGWQAVLLVGRLLSAYKSSKRRLRLQS